jgi:hypothetical protein
MVVFYIMTSCSQLWEATFPKKHTIPSMDPGWSSKTLVPTYNIRQSHNPKATI